MTRIFHKVCIDCGKEFTAHGNRAMRCFDCKREEQRRLNREYQKIKTSVERRKRRKKPAKTLTQVIRELEAYNKEHNTCLTYGQYTQLIEGSCDNER